MFLLKLIYKFSVNSKTGGKKADFKSRIDIKVNDSYQLLTALNYIDQEILYLRKEILNVILKRKMRCQKETKNIFILICI